MRRRLGVRVSVRVSTMDCDGRVRPTDSTTGRNAEASGWQRVMLGGGPSKDESRHHTIRRRSSATENGVDLFSHGPGEHSHRASKRLIFPANRQWKITGTINSTNTWSEKGWTPPDRGKITLFDSCLVVATGRAKGVIIIVAEQLVFLEMLLKAVSRKRCFA